LSRINDSPYAQAKFVEGECGGDDEDPFGTEEIEHGSLRPQSNRHFPETSTQDIVDPHRFSYAQRRIKKKLLVLKIEN
jgi:hypothetical protein